MSFTSITLLASKLIGAQTLEPGGLAFGSPILWLLTWVWEGICLGIYNLVRWLLAIVDFMQYFIQKLIGLDYWLNRTYYTLEGAIEADLIFGFLYSETVQKVFRAMVAVFFALLIIFTIYAIIRQEWRYIMGKDFGNGTGNSKTLIFRESIKAIAIVLIFPIVLMIGVISANAILASLIKALNIDTSSTLGGQLFQIASQNAVKYEKYANGGERTSVSDEVTFYIDDDTKKYITMSSGSADATLVDRATTYEAFLEKISNATKYTVNTMFEEVNPSKESSFNGYCARLVRDGEPYYVMVKCSDDDNGTNGRYAMGYYLKNVLQVKVVTSEDSAGFGGADDFSNKIGTDGFISNFNLKECYSDDIADACYHTWNYASIYERTFEFEDAEDYLVTKSGNSIKVTMDGSTVSKIGEGPTSSELISALGLGVTNAKVMYNSDQISPYFDGGQHGVVQMQAEYMVMSEVVNYMAESNLRLYMLDITSDLIDWGGHGSYYVDSRWIGSDDSGNVKYSTLVDGGSTKTTLPFVISYNDNCNETEMGNVLYFGDKIANGNEIKGANYIMCLKVEGMKDNAGNMLNAKFIPLVNNKTFTDPSTGSQYNFKSNYYASNYRGVVLAKGLLDSGATNAYRGEPTYLVSGAKTEKDKIAGKDIPYYFDMETIGGFNQFVEDSGTVVMNGNTVEGLEVPLRAANYSYSVSKVSGATDHTYQIKKHTAEEDGTTTTTDQSVTEDIIRNLQINMKLSTGVVSIGSYAGQSVSYGSKVFYLFTHLKGAQAFYFVVSADSSNGQLQLYSYTANSTEVVDAANPNLLYYEYVDGDVWSVSSSTISSTSRFYKIMYDYKSSVGTPIELLDKVVDAQATPNYFDYSKYSNGKAVYTTVDMQSINESGFSKTLYVNGTFNTTSATLMNLGFDGEGVPAVRYADPYVPDYPSSNVHDKFEYRTDHSDSIQKSKMVRFYLYDFYNASVGGTIKKYDIDNDSSPISGSEKPTDEEWYFDIKLDSNGFSFPARESYLHLYNGKKYVATIYKVASKNEGDAITDIGDLDDYTTYILYDNQNYYNIDTQNKFTNDTEMKESYEDIEASAVITCTRGNRSYNFMALDFAFGGIIPWKARMHVEMFFNTLKREWKGHEFLINEGIQFDYFFEGKASLVTFYIPSKISYWIIIIASALMIKVLGTAIWGVIKRIYEITLYFIAAPAVAATIPLDEGQKFKTNIQGELIRKVLGTYGVMLGVNVFFILLYPVKTLSQIFTAEDIAVSNSYFLKNFFSFFSLDFKAKLLNMYVYILFVLVAFTMISSLPKMISQMIGAEDVHAQGEATKSAAKKNVQGAMDMASGKTLADGAGKAMKGIKEGNFLPGGVLAKKAVDAGKGAAGWIADKAKGGVPSEAGDEDEEKKDDESSREDEDPAAAEVQNAIDSKVSAATGGQFATYADVMANGTEEQKAAAEAAKTEAEADIAANGTEEQKAALTKMQAAEAEAETEEGKEPVDAATQEAQNQFNGSMEEVAANLNGDQGSMQASTVRNMAASGNAAVGSVVANVLATKGGGAEAVKAGDKAGMSTAVNAALNGADGKGGMMTADMKKQAVLSTMSADEQTAFNNMSEKQQQAELAKYDVQASVGEDGQVGLSVQKQGEEAKAVGAQVTNGIMGQIMSNPSNVSNAEINNAVAAADSGAEGSPIAGEIANLSKQNIATAIDFNAGGSDAIGEQIKTSILDNPDDPQNGAVLDRAVMAFLQEKGNEKVLKNFQKITGLSDDDMKDEQKVLANISAARQNGSLENMGINKSAYEGQVMGALQTAVQKGEFKMSAWNMFTTTNEQGAQAYIENIAAQNLTRNADEAAFEQEASEKIVAEMQAKSVLEQFGVDTDGMNSEQLAQAQTELETKMFLEKAGVDVSKMDAAQMAQAKEDLEQQKMFEAASKATGKQITSMEEFEKLSGTEQAAAQEAASNQMADIQKEVDGEVGAVKAQATGEMLFSTFAKNSEGKGEVVGQIVDAYLGMDEEGKAEQILMDANISAADINKLKLEGYSVEDIARASAAAKLMGGDGGIDSTIAALVQAKEDPDGYNKSVLEAMQSNGDKEALNKAYQKLGDGSVVGEDEIKDLTAKAASDSSFMAATLAQTMTVDAAEATSIEAKKEAILYNRQGADLDKTLQGLGIDTKGMTEEQKLAEFNKLDDSDIESIFTSLDPDQMRNGLAHSAAFAKSLEGVSAYEAQQLLQGKTKEEVFNGLREDTKHKKIIDEAMAAEDVSTEALMEEAGADTEARKVMAEAYNQRMRVVTEGDKTKARKDAEDELLLEEVEKMGFTREKNGTFKKVGEDGKVKTYKNINEVYASITDQKEVEKQTAAYLSDEITRNKKLRAARDAFLKENKGKNQDDFVQALISNDPEAAKHVAKAAGIARDQFTGVDSLNNIQAAKALGIDKIDLGAKRQEIARNLAMEDAKKNDATFESRIEEQTTRNIDNTNRRKLAQGYGEETMAIAAALQKDDPDIMNDAMALYQQKYKGQNFSDADEFTKAAFLAENFGDRLSQTERDKIHEQTVTSHNAVKGDYEAAIYTRLTENPERFREVFNELDSFDGNDDSDAVKERLKRNAIEKEYQKYGGKLDIAADPEKMSAGEKKRYDFNKGILQQEMRDNPEVVANLFRNSNIMGQDSMILEIAKSQGLNVSLENGEFSLDGAAISTADLKAKLDTEHINNFVNKNEATKDKLLSIGAQDMTKALDKETLEIKKTEAVLGSAFLRGQVADKVLKEQGIVDKTGALDEGKVRDLIKQMLTADGRGDKANDEFINAHFNELKTELSLHEITGDGTTVGKKDSTAFTAAMQTMQTDSNLFKSSLNRELTRVIDPSNYDPNTSAQSFFEQRSLSEFKTKDNQEIRNLHDAIDAYNTEGFVGFDGFGKAMRESVAKSDVTSTLKTLVLGNRADGQREGIVGAAEAAAKSWVGAAKRMVTFKAARSVVSTIKDYKQYKTHGDNMGFASYLKQKAGIDEFERDEKGKIKLDKRTGQAIRKKTYVTNADGSYKLDKNGNKIEMGGFRRFTKTSLHIANKFAENTGVGYFIKQQGKAKVLKYKALLQTADKVATGGIVGDLIAKKKAGEKIDWKSVGKRYAKHAGKAALVATAIAGPGLGLTAVGFTAYHAGKTFLNKTHSGKKFKDGTKKFLKSGYDIMFKAGMAYEDFKAGRIGIKDVKRGVRRFFTADKKVGEGGGAQIVKRVKQISKVGLAATAGILTVASGGTLIPALLAVGGAAATMKGGSAFLNKTAIGKHIRKATSLKSIKEHYTGGFTAKDGGKYKRHLATQITKTVVKTGLAATAGILTVASGGTLIPALLAAGGAAGTMFAGKSALNHTKIGKRFKKFEAEAIADPKKKWSSMKKSFVNYYTGGLQKGQKGYTSNIVKGITKSVAKTGLTATAGILTIASGGTFIPTMLATGGAMASIKAGKTFLNRTQMGRKFKKFGNLAFSDPKAAAAKAGRGFINFYTGGKKKGEKGFATNIVKGVGRTTLAATAGVLSLVSGGGFQAIALAAGGAIGASGKKGQSKVVSGYNAVVFKMTQKLPKMCSQYDNWNRVINNKITQVKNNKSMTRSERLKEIEKLESQKIFVEKPQNYYNMTIEQKNQFDLAQDKLKREAFTDVNLAKFVKNLDRVQRVKQPGDIDIPDILTHLSTPTKDRKQKHLEALHHARATMDRFHATAAMRNAERDYGEDFEKFAQTMLTKRQFFRMMYFYHIKSKKEYDALNDRQKAEERKNRENAIKAQLAQTERRLARKVARDNNVRPESYMRSRGLVGDIYRYSDGSKKFRDASAYKGSGLSDTAARIAQQTQRQSSVVAIQNQALNIDKMMQEFIKFNAEYKGTSADFAAAFKKEFEKYGPYAKKIYEKYAKSFRGLDVSLEKRPIAVQQRKIMEDLAQELSKCKQRATSNGMIPASKELNDLFVAKTFTNATTHAELKLHQQNAEELSRLLKLIKEQRKSISYDSLIKRIASTHLSDFEMSHPHIKGKSEEAKKNLLEKYFADKLDKALKMVHNDSKYRADSAKLERLNGRRVERSSIDHTGTSAVLANAMKTANSSVYQTLTRDVKSANEKVNAEKFNLEQLTNQLRAMQSAPRTPANIAEIANINRAIKQAQVKLNNLSRVLDSAKKKKKDFENAFASSQIKEAKASNQNLAYNTSKASVVKKYEFPTTSGGKISEGTVEAKQVEMLVSKFIMSYRQTVQSMTKTEIIKQNDELKEYVDSLAKKFSDDFGKNMRDTQKVREELTRRIKLLKESNAKMDRELAGKLDEYLKKFVQSETQLNSKLRGMGIKVSGIKLKK